MSAERAKFDVFKVDIYIFNDSVEEEKLRYRTSERDFSFFI